MAALDVKTGNKPPFRTPIYHRRYIQRGINASMSYEETPERIPTIPLPVRSSLAQIFKLHKFQLTHYFSWIKPFGMAPGYPVAKVHTLVNTSPRNRSLSPQPRPAYRRMRGIPISGGVGSREGDPYYMRGVTRFKKALPITLNPYQPPIYGEGE